jgi:hypothetical protein
MLREITWQQLEEWKTFQELEPFDTERADYHSAQVVQALWNIHRDMKTNPNGWPIENFLLTFGDTPRPVIAQSLETQELLIDSWIAGSNAVLAKGK